MKENVLANCYHETIDHLMDSIYQFIEAIDKNSEAILSHIQRADMSILKKRLIYFRKENTMKFIWDKPTALILDTNIWLNFLKGSEEEVRTFRGMEKLIDENKIILFSPEQVILEWNRHYKSIIQQKLINTKDTIEQAKLLMKYMHEPTDDYYFQTLTKIESQIHLNTDIQNPDIVKDIEYLIQNKVTQIKLTDFRLKNMVIEFGLEKKKPFGYKNSMGDAVIFFSIFENFSNKIQNNNKCNYNQLYFVTNDVHDFSEGPGEEERSILHHDLKKLADEINLNYSHNIHTTINLIKNKKKVYNV